MAALRIRQRWCGWGYSAYNWVGSFCFVRNFRDLPRPDRSRPYIPQRPAWLPSDPERTQPGHIKRNKKQPATHTNSRQSCATNGPYTPGYAAIIEVIHKKSQAMSDLQKSFISGHASRNLIIYRKIANSISGRLRRTWLLRSLQTSYPQFINNYLYYYIVFVQDLMFVLHYI